MHYTKSGLFGKMLQKQNHVLRFLSICFMLLVLQPNFHENIYPKSTFNEYNTQFHKADQV